MAFSVTRDLNKFKKLYFFVVSNKTTSDNGRVDFYK